MSPTPAFWSLVDGVQPSTLAWKVLVSNNPGIAFLDTGWFMDGTYKTVNELQVSWALAVAVSGSVLGTGLVARILGHATIGVHGNEVQSTVQAALCQS